MKLFLRGDGGLFTKALRDSGYCVEPIDSLEDVPDGGAALLLASSYPVPAPGLDGNDLATINEKKLRVLCEYPKSVHGLENGEPLCLVNERAVVASALLAPALEENEILSLHRNWHANFKDIPSPLLSLARVAGYRKAVHGIDPGTSPGLFAHGDGLLVAAFCASNFIKGRYAPFARWKTLWEQILRWLTRTDETVPLVCAPVVKVKPNSERDLPNDLQAFAKASKWFGRHALYRIGGKTGVVEGFESGIECDGRQLVRPWPRNDCLAESAMVFALDGEITGSPASLAHAGEIMDYIWFSKDFINDDPANSAYGLVNWYERGQVFYGDDNARSLLASCVCAAILGDAKWDKPILRCVLANFRTTGRLGFRHNRLDMAKLEGAEAWKRFFNEDHVSLAPHYQSWLWAVFMLARRLTGFEGFSTRASRAFALTMEKYPHWNWTNGLTQEIARMALPLAIRTAAAPETAGDLGFMLGEMEKYMQPSGAIREGVGLPELGTYPPPSSNAKYGTNEAPLIQEEGDPCCDLLYTANFLFAGLREASALDGKHRPAEDRLAAFVKKIQIESKTHDYLDGVWMRGFDFDLWEYYGSAADNGWGAWCVESGWTNAWLAATLALRHLDTSLFALVDGGLKDRFKAIFPALLEEMLGGAEVT